MQVLYSRCCGLDVHKRSITGCCLWFNNTQQRQEETRQFGTQTAELRRLATWLREHEVKKVVMEATGSYWRPVCNLLEMEGFAADLGQTAAHESADWPQDGQKGCPMECRFVPARLDRSQLRAHSADAPLARSDAHQNEGHARPHARRQSDRSGAGRHQHQVKQCGQRYHGRFRPSDATSFCCMVSGTRRNSRSSLKGGCGPRCPN